MRSLATDLQNLSVELSKKQSTYLKRLREQKEGSGGVDLEMNLNESMPRFEDEFSDMVSLMLTFRSLMLSCQDLNTYMSASAAFCVKSAFPIDFSDHQISEMKRSEHVTAEREKEIKQVVESVNELAQIMKDLSALVIDQGTIVDRIDYNIQNVASSVDEGFKQLQKVNVVHQRP